MLRPLCILLLVLLGTSRFSLGLEMDSLFAKANTTNSTIDSTHEYIKISWQKFSNGNYQDALGNALQFLTYAENSNKPLNLAQANILVGSMYYYNHESYPDILSYFHKARYYIYKFNIDSLKSKIDYNIGVIYVETAVIDSAVFYLNNAIEAAKQNQNYHIISRCYCVLAELYMQKKRNLTKAFYYVNKAEKYAKLTDGYADYAFARLKRGLYYYNSNDFIKALEYFYDVKDIYEKNKDAENRMYIYYLIASSKACSYDTTIKSAYTEYLSLKDSVFHARSSEATARYKALYETEKKEHENKILLQQNQLKQAELFQRNIIILALGVLILLVFSLLMWRLNVINLRKREQELEATKKLQEEKERISRDLHDNIGSSISFISTKTDWIIKNRKVGNSMIEDLNQVEHNAKKLMERLRETIWTITHHEITNFEFVDKLKPYIQNNLIIPYHIKDELETEQVIDAKLVLDIYRCCQEVIANINKHSNANQVWISFTNNHNSKLTINIRDNGTGFSEDDTHKEGHYGIQNLKSRLNNKNVTYKILSEVGNGTQFMVEIK